MKAGSMLTSPENELCPWLGIPFRPRPNSGPPAAASMISEWISQCASWKIDWKHSQCPGRSTIRWSTEISLPTRVLKILGPQKVHLVVPDQRSTNFDRYACLSHCWGNAQCIKTTSFNLDSYLEDIPWNSLPQTFRDALELTRHLGLSYLWIDSLCILQDSMTDWRHEGSKMASIYASSFVTIAATRSANPDGGLYTTDAYRSAHTNGCIELPYGIYIRNKKGQVVDGEPAQVTLPLLTRAWVLQERFLSPRVVHFGTNGLSWECNTICTSENVFNELCYMGTSINRIYDRRAKSPLHQWHVIVSEYTKLKLSFERDIFPALQGIARYIAKQRGSRYLAGLWEDTLLYDLFWVYSGSESGMVISVGTDTYRAPTWSWASRIAHVKWWTIRQAYHTSVSASVVHVETIPIGDDPMGEVQGGGWRSRDNVRQKED